MVRLAPGSYVNGNLVSNPQTNEDYLKEKAQTTTSSSSNAIKSSITTKSSDNTPEPIQSSNNNSNNVSWLRTFFNSTAGQLIAPLPATVFKMFQSTEDKIQDLNISTKNKEALNKATIQDDFASKSFWESLGIGHSDNEKNYQNISKDITEKTMIIEKIPQYIENSQALDNAGITLQGNESSFDMKQTLTYAGIGIAGFMLLNSILKK